MRPSSVHTPLHVTSMNRAWAYASLALSMALVGSYVALSKPLVLVFPVFLLAWLRFGIGGLAMWTWLRKPADEPPISPRTRALLFLESFLGNFLFSICMLFGVSMTTAVAAGVVMSSIPAVVAVLSWLFLRERIPPLRWAAVGLALLGLWLFLGGPGGVSLAFSTTDLLALSAGMGFAANNVVSRAAQGIPMVSKTLAVFVGCGLFSLAMAGDALGAVASIGPVVWVALLAYGFLWLLLATATWQFGVTHIESSRAGVLLLAELLVAVLSAIWFGDESMTPIEWLGGALIATAALVEAVDFSPAPNQNTEATRQGP